ncbi:MAG: U32 family peptidase [Chitinivibrionales bacterium]|nr:U32 family peptidase [Chitinivibrionales bacterium]
MPPSSIELLAPAGSLDALHAAIDAGANAVYLGLTDFNARLRAKNFTLQTLAYALPYAQRLRVKVYVTLNTLIKQQELSGLITLLHQLDSMGVDAIIVQDLGAVAIIRKWFPRLAIHASTQMALHNSAGVATAQSLGIKRVILSRELSLDEIITIRKASTCDLEVFVHGALCYSISGLCLASSFLGGSSGNRGRCTQACRRSYAASDNKGFYFSPDDFCALDYVRPFMQAGIASLKIEGRMKNPQYVHTVTGVYRAAIDSPDNIDGLKERLRYDFGRSKCSFFLSGTLPPGIIRADRTAGVGILLGPVLRTEGQTLFVNSAEEIAPGDRLRIQPASGFEGVSAKVVRVAAGLSGERAITLEPGVALHKGDSVYCIGRVELQKNLPSHPRINEQPRPFPKQCSFTFKLMQELSAQTYPRSGDNGQALTIQCNSMDWLALIGPQECSSVVITGDREEYNELLGKTSLLQKWGKRLVCGLPPFIAEDDLAAWKVAINALMAAGLTRFQISTIGQRALFPPAASLRADTSVWCLNQAAQKQLAAMGITQFNYSVEDDIMNISVCGKGGALVLFGFMPLFISRIPPALKPDNTCEDSYGNGFFLKKRHGLYYLLGQKPLCLFPKRKKLVREGVSHFVIDVRFMAPERQTAQTLLRQYREEERVDNSTMFNFKMGLK